MRHLEQLAAIAVFNAVVETRSFTGAAERLRISKSYVSEQVSRLERHLGARLLHRNNRRVAPTDEGLALHRECAPLLAQTERAAADALDRAGETAGLLRIGAPLWFAQLQLVPLLPAFLRFQPKLRVELVAADRIDDLVAANVDVAIHVSDTRRPGLIARKLGSDRAGLCGSPDYLRRAGRPLHPRELAAHHALAHTRPGQRDECGRLGAADILLLRDAALAGLGVALLPASLIARELERGALVELLAEFTQPALGVYAVYLDRRQLPRRVRVFLDFLAKSYPRSIVERAGGDPGEDGVAPDGERAG
jgi:DNA-binding transcriptional LysR family regulator